MAIKFKHLGVSFTADTPVEAAQFIALLKQQEAEKAKRRWFNRETIRQGGPVALMAQIDEDIADQLTPDVFVRFIESLGSAQKKALTLLVERRQLADEELRAELNVSGNQALAGILSGISKNAAALDIPARSIFTIKNFRIGGKRRSRYSISDEFLQAAKDMNWPYSPED